MLKRIGKDSLVLSNGVVARVTGHDLEKGFILEGIEDKKNFTAHAEEISLLPTTIDNHELMVNKRKAWFDDSRIKREEYDIAKTRFLIIAEYKRGSIKQKEAVKQLGLSNAQFFRVLKQHDDELGAISMLRGVKGASKGTRRLGPDVEVIIDQCIEEHYNGKTASVANVWQFVESHCTLKKLPVPSRNSVHARIKALPERVVYEKRYGKEAAKQKFDAKPSQKHIQEVLGRVQVDHTKVDIIICDDERNPLMRPWLTVVLDVKTRVILGYYISLTPPNASTVALAMVAACFPKNKLLERLGDKRLRYPFYGVFKIVHMDNAAEFRSDVLHDACIAWGIDPEYRPVWGKHYGGHVERLIGTLMGEVHFLPGTTYSNVVEKDDYDSAKHACMTLAQFELWFARQVAIYHGRTHEGLGDQTPEEAWIEGMREADGTMKLPGLVTDPKMFMLDFLPQDTRIVTTKGLEFRRSFYWTSELGSQVGRRVTVKYNPASLHKIWVKVNGRYIDVPFSNPSERDRSFNEDVVKLAAGRRRPGSVEDPTLHQFRLDNHALVKEAKQEAKKKTKRDKQQKKAKEVHENNMAEVLGPQEASRSSFPTAKPFDPNGKAKKLTWKP
ncbi:Mu transposase C-terminal domain-containing protein [Pseudomonas coronafaciens]|uniref:Mu transposase C-terminal domain-containing protein n=1 Tax=Pseudomonas coronafaciens TaxID=53409 RepID=UPI0006D622C1|nr:Mu transposase C-terminal domain-containing protein [Pseudomonas coronafaciens]KPZ27208.1 Transposase, IS30 family [Pseudomonas coronafaciens pv. zizaniae]